MLCDDTLYLLKINGCGLKVHLNDTVFSLFLENKAEFQKKWQIMGMKIVVQFKFMSL